MLEHNIPDGWIRAKISDISIKGLQRKPATDESFTYVDIGSIDRSLKKVSDPQVISGESAPSRARKVIESGDVLVSLTRPNLNAVALVDQTYHKQIASTGFEVIKPVLVDSRYIFALVRSKEFVDQISGVVQGALYPAAKSSDVQDFEFPLPPLAEQKVIADKLDTLLAQVENTKARLERIPQILKRFRQSVLAAAVSGRLIDAQPESIAQLEELVDTENGARKPVSATIRKTIQGTIPYYGATGIVDYLNDYTHEGRYLLVGEDGANLLSKSKDLAFIVEGKMWVNNHAHVLKERPGVNLDFVKIAINSLDLTPWITGSAQPKLTKKSLCGLPITNFTLDEQTEIVRRVDQLFSHADRIEQQASSALARVNNLTQSILAKAFRGELTEQWRRDNPELIGGENSAEALLERIKAERAAMKPVKRTRNKRTTV